MRAVAAAELVALTGWSPTAGAAEPVKIGLEIPLSPPGGRPIRK